MNIVYKHLEEIYPYANNPRKNDDAVEGVAKSIQEFGFKVPIVIDKNNVIVTGHTRYKAAMRIGMTEVPCIVADDLTEDQVNAFRLVDNKVAEASEWDFDALAIELGNIDIDLSGYGFDISVDDYDVEIQEDDYAEQDVPTITKIGDIWQLGEHRLMCGDSTKQKDFDLLLEGKKTDLLLTDPPYGINAVKCDKVGGGGELHFGKVGFGTKGKNKYVDCTEYSPIIGDDTTETAKQNYAIATNYTNNQIIFGGNYFTDFLPPSRCWIVWDKQNTGNFADAELAWTSFNKGVKLYHFMWNGLAREGSRDVELKKRIHPTQKPVGMIGFIINDFTEENDTILDCFGGSGSTLIACEQLNRKCYMMELDPHYCDVIIDRWEHYTGMKAVQVNG